MSTCTFGPFRLDLSAGQLRRGDAVVPLAPKAFTVLQHLVTRSGQLITKDELLELAWADVHVGDGALKVCVREIRRALDDDPKTPLYIETAHRRGYRFIAPVSIDAERACWPGADGRARRCPRPGCCRFPRRTTRAAATSTSRIRSSAAARGISSSSWAGSRISSTSGPSPPSRASSTAWRRSRASS